MDWSSTFFKQNLLPALILAFASCGLHAQYVPEFPLYPPYHQVIDIIEEFPDDISAVINLGESWGHGAEPIRALIISDNPTEIEHEPVVLLTGVIHGREPIGVRAVLELADSLVTNYHHDPLIKQVVDNYQIVIVPVLNRWGYDQRQRKNAPSTDANISSGVDLNRNGLFGWDRCDNSIDNDPDGNGLPDCFNAEKGTFRGMVANSEYETQTMQDLVEWLKPVFGVVFHSGTGGTRGQIFHPYGINDRGDDGISGNADDHLLTELQDVGVGENLARIMMDNVLDSRLQGLFCTNPDDIPGACNRPSGGRTGSAGGTGNNYYALTGMFELLVESNSEKFFVAGQTRYNAWVSNYMYEEEQVLRSDRQKRLDFGREYARTYADGMQGLLGDMMCSNQPSAANLKGPGFTGRVTDANGQPVEATIRVLELDSELHGDFFDSNGNPANRNWQPYGEEDFKLRKAQADTGRFYRLLPKSGDPGWLNEYTLEISSSSLQPRTITVNNPADNGCLEDLGTIELATPAICAIPPTLTGIANGATLPAASATIDWTSNGCHYWVWAGDAPDRNDFHNQSMAGATSVTISGYPEDGSDVHLTLLYRNTNIIGAPWARAYFSFKAPQDTLCTIPPTLTSHAPGATLAAGSDTLSWTSNGCHYWVWAGDGPDRNNFHNQSMAGATSFTLTGYESDGSDVYLTLLYRNTNIVGAPWKREYFAFSAP